MKSFLLAIGFIACFLLGAFAMFRLCEYYNRLIRQAQRQALQDERKRRPAGNNNLFLEETEKRKEGGKI